MGFKVKNNSANLNNVHKVSLSDDSGISVDHKRSYYIYVSNRLGVWAYAQTACLWVSNMVD